MDTIALEHRKVDTGRVRLHVVEAGDGPPVLLLHGWPQHWYAWRHVIPRLARSHRVIALDLRGAGDSDAPTTGYATDDLVADVIALLDALDLPAVDIVGHDRGGSLAFRLALEHPDRVRRLVALNAVHPYSQLRRMAPHAWRYLWTPFVETRLVGRWVLRHCPWFLRRLLRAGVSDRAAMPREAVETYVASVRRPPYARAGEELMHEFAYHEILPMLRHPERRRLETPTLLLVGGADRLTPPGMLGDATPYTDQLTIEQVEGVGHHLPEERPELVAERILAHLQ
ncbi:alpha/beta fold hydrolase [Flexivirga sp. B27]